MADATGTPGSKNNPHIKDPNAVLDYSEDWSAFLVPVADTIDTIPNSVEVLFPDPACTLLVTRQSDDGMIVTVWLSGGRLGKTEQATVRIHTVAGRIDDRTMFFKMVQK